MESDFIQFQPPRKTAYFGEIAAGYTDKDASQRLSELEGAFPVARP